MRYVFTVDTGCTKKSSEFRTSGCSDESRRGELSHDARICKTQMINKLWNYVNLHSYVNLHGNDIHSIRRDIKIDNSNA